MCLDFEKVSVHKSLIQYVWNPEYGQPEQCCRWRPQTYTGDCHRNATLVNDNLRYIHTVFFIQLNLKSIAACTTGTGLVSTSREQSTRVCVAHTGQTTDRGTNGNQASVCIAAWTSRGGCIGHRRGAVQQVRVKCVHLYTSVLLFSPRHYGVVTGLYDSPAACKHNRTKHWQSVANEIGIRIFSPGSSRH